MKYYAGIGSRRTPPDVLALMTEIGAGFARAGWVLRSGGAPGADTAFEDGCIRENGSKVIFIPWDGFQDRHRSHPDIYCGVCPEALALARRFHPAWDKCSPAAQKLHARNSYQVLGTDLDMPASLVVCWTPGGLGTGGTGQALRIARANNIRIHDLAIPRIRAEYEHRLASQP